MYRTSDGPCPPERSQTVSGDTGTRNNERGSDEAASRDRADQDWLRTLAGRGQGLGACINTVKPSEDPKRLKCRPVIFSKVFEDGSQIVSNLLYIL